MSGSRLPGDHESADRHRTDSRAETRLSGDLAERFESYIDAHGAKKSEVLRDALDDYLPSSANSQYVLPKEPELRDAYLALAGDTKHVMSVESAVNILSKHTHPNDPKRTIREDVLKPLDGSGLISVTYGRVAVHPLTPREEVSIVGDDDE